MLLWTPVTPPLCRLCHQLDNTQYSHNTHPVGTCYVMHSHGSATALASHVGRRSWLRHKARKPRRKVLVQHLEHVVVMDLNVVVVTAALVPTAATLFLRPVQHCVSRVVACKAVGEFLEPRERAERVVRAKQRQARLGEAQLGSRSD